jgi:hypothetical protein
MAPVERLVAHASREVQLLAALTPVEVLGERARLVAELRAGRSATPRWTYVRKPHDDLRRALGAAEQALVAAPPRTIERLYLDRVRELSLEAALCDAAGTCELPRLARERFAPAEPPVARAASALCAAWLAEPALPPSGEPIVSDAPDPRSLLSRMRAAVGDRKLPFAVVTRAALASLAATGDRVILVAPGRPVHDEDAARTVVHEVEGHALPRAHALAAPMAILRWGTARGGDDQEGRALVMEERAGLLGPRRRRQLAARHWAVQAMLDRASFVDVVRGLAGRHDVDVADAVIVAERAFRGGDGMRAGLGRERVYLEGFVRVRAHLAEHPEDDDILARGQIALSAAADVRALGLMGR